MTTAIIVRVSHPFDFFLRARRNKTYITFTLSQYQRLIARKIDNSGMLCYDSPGIDYQIEGLAEHLINLFRVAIEAFIRLLHAGGDDGVLQLSHQGKRDGIVRDPDPHRFLVRQHDLGYQFCGLQDKGIGSGDERSHDPIGVVGDMGILADITEICADDTETFVFVVSFEVMDFFYGLFVKQIAPKTVYGVSGVGDNPFFLEGICDLTDEPLLRIFGVDLDDHAFCSLLFYSHYRLGDVERVITYLFKVGQYVDEDKSGVDLADPVVEPLYMSLPHGVFKVVNSFLVGIRLWLDAAVFLLYPIDYQFKEFSAHGVDLLDVICCYVREGEFQPALSLDEVGEVFRMVADPLDVVRHVDDGVDLFRILW